MFSFFKSKTNAAPDIYQGVASAPSSVVAQSQMHGVDSALNPAAVMPEALAIASVIDSLAQLPSYQSLLTLGDKPICRVAPADRHDLTVLGVGAKQAVVLYTQKMAHSVQLTALNGGLVSSGYKLLQALCCDTQVIKNLVDQSGSEAAGRGAAKNQYMDAANEWIGYAVANNATDIHIQTLGTSSKVRFRVHGEMEDMRTPSQGIYTSEFATSTLGYLFNNEQAKKSGSQSTFQSDEFQYCMIPLESHGHLLKLRFQSLKGEFGPKGVLRLLPTNPNAKTLTFKQLGYADSQIANQWLPAINTPAGIILISGITGSGKSTTQKTVIESILSDGTKIIYTIEDPIEYPIKGAHQIPIQRNVADKEASQEVIREAVTALLRGDLDGAMIGEVRDEVTANAMLQLAETGHLALGTLHSHLISAMIPRLVNPEIGLTREALTSPNILTVLVYQALVPLLCLHCALTTDQAIDQVSVRDFVAELDGLQLATHNMRWHNKMGCTHCNQRGTVDQTVVAEMMMPDETWLELVRKGRDSDALRYWRSTSDGRLDSPNMEGKTVFEHTLYKALVDGNVDARQCLRFDLMKRFLSNWKRAHSLPKPHHSSAYSARPILKETMQ